jgi:hypothetical protein
MAVAPGMIERLNAGRRRMREDRQSRQALAAGTQDGGVNHGRLLTEHGAGGGRGGRGRGNFGGNQEFNRRKTQFFVDEGVAAVLDFSRGDGGTVFVQGPQGVSRDPKGPAQPPQVTLTVEHYGRIWRTLDKKIPVTLQIDADNRFFDTDLNAFNIVADLPGILIEVTAPRAGPATGKPIQVQIGALDPAVLPAAASKVTAILAARSDIRDLDDGQPLPGIDWKIEVDKSEAAKYGAGVNRILLMLATISASASAKQARSGCGSTRWR